VCRWQPNPPYPTRTFPDRWTILLSANRNLWLWVKLTIPLDLLEEFRPIAVDRLVLELIRTNAIPRERFEHPADRPDAVYLNEAGRAQFVDRYQDLLQSRFRLAVGKHTTLRNIFLLQTQAMARVIRGEQERYVGYIPSL